MKLHDNEVDNNVCHMVYYFYYLSLSEYSIYLFEDSECVCLC